MDEMYKELVARIAALEAKIAALEKKAAQREQNAYFIGEGGATDNLLRKYPLMMDKTTRDGVCDAQRRPPGAERAGQSDHGQRKGAAQAGTADPVGTRQEGTRGPADGRRQSIKQERRTLLRLSMRDVPTTAALIQRISYMRE